MSRRVIFWVLLFSLAISPAPANAGQPGLELSPQSWNFGEIYQWTNPSTTIQIKNTGDAPLHLLDVKASCGCTAVVLSDRVIEPGRTGEMKIDFASYNFSGPINKIVKLVTDDPANPERVIRITGSIKPDKSAVVVVEPGYMDIGIVAPYETRYFDITIKNDGNADLPVTGVELAGGFFLGSTYPGRVPPLSSQTVRIGYKPPVAKGPIDGQAKVLVSYPGQEDQTVRIVGYVGEAARGADSLVVTPTGFRVVPGAGQADLSLALKNDGKAAVLVEGAETSLEGGTASVSSQTLAPGETGSVGVRLDTSSLRPGTKGYVYIRVAVPVAVEGPVDK